MPLDTTPDGRYTIAWQTPGEGDGNSVIYDRGPNLEVPWPGTPIWDRFSYEAGLGESRPPAAPPPSLPPAAPLPTPPSPEAVGAPRLIQLTDTSDGHIPPRMMSDKANAWVDGQTALVFCGHEDGLARFFRVGLITGQVQRLGSLSVPYRGETENWYWLPDGSLILIEGPRLRRLTFAGEDRRLASDEIVLDISSSHPGCDLWQASSSDDGQVHAATVRQIVAEGSYPKIGTVVQRSGQQIFFDAIGTLDESQLTRNGRQILIKENRGSGDDNRLINLDTSDTQWLRDQDRAMGHSDCGPDFVVGEADKPDPGMCGWWDLTKPLTPERFHPLFPTLNMGYISARGGRILHSGDTHLSWVNRQTGEVTLLLAHGGGSAYDDRVKANLDPTARVACFMSSFGGSRRGTVGRREVYLAVLG
jgi:hypothetical protein